MDPNYYTHFSLATAPIEEPWSQETLALSEHLFQQAIQPAAVDPAWDHYLGNPQPYAPSASSTANRANYATTPGMMAGTPSTASPVTPVAYRFQMAPLMQAPQVHHQQLHYQLQQQRQQQQQQEQTQQQQQQQQRQRQQRLEHICPQRDELDDRVALIVMCAYSRMKGKHGESCEHVGADATEAAIREFRSGQHASAQARFHRQASKNLNQKNQRAQRAAKKAAARRDR